MRFHVDWARSPPRFTLTPEQRKKLREMIEAGPMMEGMGMKHDQERGMKKK